ncbi:MAG: branched-chain amino acid ABC transporter permease, partial [Oscillospiraceae bacterium]|nr:branched-chain amino acid ABC transporter permease [Oscillospiraceae bacterium]
MSEKIKTVRSYRRNVAIILGVILAIFLLIPTFVKNPYTLNVFILIFYMSTLSMAWNLLGGMTGQNSLGHAAYMGLGAYAASMLITKAHMNPWLSAVLGV